MLRIGAHVGQNDPVTEASARKADLVQFFLGDPQDFKNVPTVPGGDAETLKARAKADGVDLYVHAPYVVNVATTNNRIRIPSRKLLAEHADAAASIGAKALIVHGGHLLKDDDPRSASTTGARRSSAGPHRCRSSSRTPPAATTRWRGASTGSPMLWDALDGFDVGFCLDTCHAHAGGEELLGVVDRVKAITGRIDLVHCNDSKDPFDSGRDRHENFSAGEIDADAIVAVVEAAGAPVVCETPGGAEGQGADIALLRGSEPP